ncbi:monofunctional biosynthetic peptidoglycan transglycosylase [Curvibacter sp. APW13]|uniref:monofunctional biosynthetic peptidoglycan transglycosylase n=1 Tax=Curvibacter sp. APW13 TaxID=3077236 RepID=UPI0028DF0836|nr:monofunctional biosynthetic peptidoglycan transglycosylase [Curvibacter sp. APW13]MDT8989787.1 monofunctional biosynthetic peptidoglycan transglycosylase [Curvibacter sp. APW13]
MRSMLRWAACCAGALLLLQFFFIARIALWAVWAPESTTFERSQAWQVAQSKGGIPPWRQQWVPYSNISNHLKRAVIASEDDAFADHDGVNWDAIEKAWEKNAKAEKKAEARPSPTNGKPTKPPKVVGGSTITQQLAKNLFLSGERTLLRKAQEFVLTMSLELLLSKERILEIYLNHVEWGEGVFGAQAAAQHYFRKNAAQLSAYEAARLAVMLPRPKYFEKLPNSAYLSGRAEVIVARMPSAQLP